MNTQLDLNLTLSVAAIVAREAVGLTSTANRIIEQSDALIQEHLGRPHRLDERELATLAANIGRQQALMAALSDNALVAVRLASKHLTVALDQSRSEADAGSEMDEDQRSATRLLGALRELERAIHRSEQQMREVSEMVTRTADHAGPRLAVAQTYTRLLARLRGPTAP